MAGKPLAADDWRRADVVGWFVSWKRKLIGRYWDPSGFDLLILVPASTMAKSLALALPYLTYSIGTGTVPPYSVSLLCEDRTGQVGF